MLPHMLAHAQGLAVMHDRGLMEEEPVFATHVRYHGEPVGYIRYSVCEY